jgi:hypothetical protein
MKYIPILTHNSETETAFEIHIISKKEQKQVGIGSVIFCKSKDKIKLVQCEYYVPEEYTVSESAIEKECSKIIKSMREFEKDG